MKKYFKTTIICLLLFFTAGMLHAQNEATGHIEQAGTYLQKRTDAVAAYLSRSNKIQQQLLKRLHRKEQKMLRRLAKQDSALYKQYISRSLNYDSIILRSKDSSQRYSGNTSLFDSLNGVERYIKNQGKYLDKTNDAGHILQNAGIHIPGTERLQSLQQQLNAQNSIDQLIQQHTTNLEEWAGNTPVKGLESIQKQVYYAREKMKAYKEIADDPDEAEMKALEYLEGTEGFNQYLHTTNNNAFGGLGNDATAEDLQRMGYQTKSQVSNALQQKLGNSLGSVQQQMGQQIQQYSEKFNDLKQKAGALKAKATEAQQTLADIKEAKSSLQNTTKPTFKKNAEKGKPFWQRIEMQYNFQTSRASTDGLKPAMLNLGINVGYKQSERFSMGLGMAFNLGFGQNWQHLKPSYEGINLRAYVDHILLYGFSLQAGYERAFIPSNRAYLTSNSDPNNNNHPTIPSPDNPLQQTFGGRQQTAYIGIMKRYRISSKWNGTFLVGYNFLWNDGGWRSPWMLRFGWGK